MQAMNSRSIAALRWVGLSSLLVLAAGCAGVTGGPSSPWSVYDPPWLSPWNQSTRYPPAGESPTPSRSPVQLGSPGAAPAGEQPALPDEPPADGPTLLPRQQEPGAAGDADRTPPAPQTERAAGRLELDIEAPASEQVDSGVTFRLTVRNAADVPVAGVVVECEFDDALVFPGREEKKVVQALERIPAGASRQLALTLFSRQTGEHCVRFTVTVGGAEAVWKSVCIDFTEKRLDVTLLGPSRRTLGTRAEFTAKLLNTSARPVSGVRVAVMYDERVLAPRAGTTGARRSRGRMSWNLGTLQPGDGLQLQVEFECIAAAPRAPLRLRADAADMPTRVVGAELAVNRAAGGIEVQVCDRRDPLGVGEQTEYLVTVRNRRREPLRRVQLTARVPQSLRLRSADLYRNLRQTAAAQRSTAAKAEFPPIGRLEPGESVTYRIRADGVRPGDGWFSATVRHALQEGGLEVFEATTVNE